MRSKKKWAAVVVLLAVVLTAVAPGVTSRASGDFPNEATKPEAVVTELLSPFEGKPGETIQITLPIKASKYTIRKPVISLELKGEVERETENGTETKKVDLPFELVSDFKFARDDVKDGTIIQNIVMGKTTYVTFSLKIKESARKGDYNLGKMLFVTTDSFNDYWEVELTQKPSIKIRVTEERRLPEFRIIEQDVPDSIKPEDEFSIGLKFQNDGELSASDIKIRLTGAEESGFIPQELYNTIEANILQPGGTVNADFAFKAAKTMQSGVKSLKAIIDFTLDDGTTYQKETPFYIEAADKEPVKVTENSDVQLVKTTCPKSVKPDGEVNIRLQYKNKGEDPVTDVKVQLGGYSEANLIPNFIYDTVNLGELEAGKAGTAEFSLTAAKSLTAGTKTLTAKVTYKAPDGTVYDNTVSLFIEGQVDEKKEDGEGTDMELVSASYPKRIGAEQSISIRLQYQNVGKKKVTGVKVQLGGYSEAGFIPNFLYDTVDLADLEAGKSAIASFSLSSAKSFTAGTKNLTAKVTYTLPDGSTCHNTTSLFLEGEVEEEKKPVTNSMPKLLVQDYNLGVEKLMAGSEFIFQFNVQNTHSSAVADNIKVTVSSEDGTFSIVEGSSSFLIPTIGAGEVESCEIPLKVKGDAATGGYDLAIKFEYEYAAKDENGNDISKSDSLDEKLKIPVYSNDRPMVSNIMVGYWEPPRFGELTTMSFEFYNMGKSPLYNVTATVEGDFDAAGSMVMIGNVDPGTGKSWELNVTPMVEGFGTGTLHISYEDSNGNISTFDESFESEIQVIDNTPIDPGFNDPNGGMIDVDGNGVSNTKKPILPVWAFVLIQVALVLIAPLVTKSIIIKAYKKKQLKRLDEELD